MANNTLKVWIEISKSALQNNFKILRERIRKETEIWAVVKSNAYGHGIYDFSPFAEEVGVDGFCVDSVLEGRTLREHGITKPILVLGSTLPELYQDAIKHDITLTISSSDALVRHISAIEKNGGQPNIHLKLDTGMHRQGIFVHELADIISKLRKHNVKLTGVYSHLATAKRASGKKYAARQLETFQEGVKELERAGYTSLMKHLSATTSALLYPEHHFDMVRVGAGLFGFPPSRDTEKEFLDAGFTPVLSLYSIVGEVKNVSGGECFGYDLTACIEDDASIAVIPVGYWHGLPRALSNQGNVLVQGKHAPILGLVAMDITTVDVTGIHTVPGDRVTIIGKDKDAMLTAWDVAEAASTVPQELLTRINPLIKRIIVD